MEEGDSTHTHTTGERRKEEEDEDGGQHTHRTYITHQGAVSQTRIDPCRAKVTSPPLACYNVPEIRGTEVLGV